MFPIFPFLLQYFHNFNFLQHFKNIAVSESTIPSKYKIAVSENTIPSKYHSILKIWSGW